MLFFQIIKADFPMLLAPFSTTNVLTTKVTSRSSVAHTVTVQLFTNLGVLEVPVRVHTGFLTVNRVYFLIKLFDWFS